MGASQIVIARHPACVTHASMMRSLPRCAVGAAQGSLTIRQWEWWCDTNDCILLSGSIVDSCAGTSICMLCFAIRPRHFDLDKLRYGLVSSIAPYLVYIACRPRLQLLTVGF